MKTAKDIMVKEIIKINKSNRLSYAIKLMDKYRISRLIVIDEKDNIVGILTEKDIMDRLGAARTRNLTPSRLAVSSVMNENVYSVDPETSIMKVIELMVNKKISTIPVIVNSKVVGLITKSNILELIKDYTEPVVQDVKDDFFKKITPDYRLIAARQTMLEGNLEYLIVVVNDRPIGVITERDIAKAYVRLRLNENIKHLDEILNRVYIKDIVTPTEKIQANTQLGSAVKLLLEKRLKAVPIVNKADDLEGGLSRWGLIKAIADGKIVI
ncbi:MAG: CBS domain-containing protein [Candidatus Asgardarchaeia archaeon]